MGQGPSKALHLCQRCHDPAERSPEQLDVIPEATLLWVRHWTRDLYRFPPTWVILWFWILSIQGIKHCCASVGVHDQTQVLLFIILKMKYFKIFFFFFQMNCFRLYTSVCINLERLRDRILSFVLLWISELHVPSRLRSILAEVFWDLRSLPSPQHCFHIITPSDPSKVRFIVPHQEAAEHHLL